jgi:hypothetical protein
MTTRQFSRVIRGFVQFSVLEGSRVVNNQVLAHHVHCEEGEFVLHYDLRTLQFKATEALGVGVVNVRSVRRLSITKDSE